MKSMLKSLMSVAVAALAFTSCSTDATDEVIAKNEPKTLKVTATIDQTRTTMAGDHVKLNWSDNDEILFYIGENATQKTDAHKINAKSGGTITGVTFKEGDKVFANYSLDNEEYSEGVQKAEIKIDHEQNQTAANVFAGENLPMIAKSTIKDGAVALTFKPFGCVLVFNVYGTVENETIKSIKFDPGVACCGYQKCDLTIDASDYVGLDYRTSATVTLGTPAAIGTAKPTNTQIGENQVYLVVAPFNYAAATFTVTTEAGKTYTFKTANGIDCSQNSARVVNLNLANAAEMQPAIEVPTVPEQPSDGEDNLTINNIVFKNFAAGVTAQVTGVYNDAELTQQLDSPWITYSNTTIGADGVWKCAVAANTTTASRTAYIGIECGGVKAAIAITQVAPGATPQKYYVKVTSGLEDWTGEYLIVYEKSDAEAYVWNLKDAVGCYITATPSNSSILSNETTDKCKVAISKSGNGYLLLATGGDNANKYIYRDEAKNGLDFGEQSVAEQYLNTITFETSYIKIASSGIYIQFYATTGSDRFRYYKTEQKKVQLYKLQ